MQQSENHIRPDILQFPRQVERMASRPFSQEMLRGLLEDIYSAQPPFTGYLMFAGDEGSLLFLFFLYGTPYGAGSYKDSKPGGYSIEDLGREVVKSTDKQFSVTLCETSPTLLKSMMLFLQNDPVIKGPATLVDIENIVRQIGEDGAQAMIALRRDDTINFYIFKDGKGSQVYYADSAFERPAGMTIDEEMLLYAFQPGDEVQAYIFRDMAVAAPADPSELDRDSLHKLLTVGYLKNRRKSAAEAPPVTDGAPDVQAGASQQQPPPSSCVVLSVESGPLKGELYTLPIPCTIGRKDCDLILSDRFISRRHAEIKIIENKLVIVDLASTNGTRVNGKKVTMSRVVQNDLISIGPVDLRVFPM